jgi:predicted deacylase
MTGAEQGLVLLPVASLASGHEMPLHLWELTGARPGPTVGLVAGVHGDQTTGVETVHRLVARLRGTLAAGTILALPVANPYAYQARSRHSPVDGHNLNRLFPGDPDGEFSAQLAFAIYDRVVRRCDYLVDFHSGGKDGTVDYGYFYGDGGLARAFGCQLLLPGPAYPGALSPLAHAAGINVMASELGGANQRNEHYVQRGVTGAVNVLRSLGMLPGEPERPARQVTLSGFAVVRPHHGGILMSMADSGRLGDTIPGGTELGYVVSPYTGVRLETFTAPYSVSVLALTRETVTDIEAGEYAFILGDGSAVPGDGSAEPATRHDGAADR